MNLAPENPYDRGPSFNHFALREDDLAPRSCHRGAPLTKKPKGLIFLVENKLIGIDILLPIAFELRAENPDLPILFLFIRQNYMDGVRRNYVLWEGMREVGTIDFLIHDGDRRTGILGKAVSGLRLFRYVRWASAAPYVLISRKDTASWPVNVLTHAVLKAGGVLVSCASIAYPMSRALIRSLVTQESRSVHRRLQADRHWLFHPLQEIEQQTVTNAPMQVIGTPKRFPRWLEYLKRFWNENRVTDSEGRAIHLEDRQPLVIFYPGDHDLPDLSHPSACRDSFVMTLRAVRDTWPELPVLIKPHVICDLDELERELEAFRDLDIRVTHAHPQLLAMIAIACVTTNGTSVTDDIYASETTMIDTSVYATEILEDGGSLFPNRGRIDCSKPERLAVTLQQLKSGRSDFQIAESGHLLWPKPERISDYLWSAE